MICLAIVTLISLISGFSSDANATPKSKPLPQSHELFQKGVDQLNHAELRGTYFSVGKQSDSGTFVANLVLPSSMSWKLSSDNEKVMRVFEWDEKTGIKFDGDAKETNTDVFSKFAQTAIGAITLNTFFNQVLALSDPSSIMSLSTSSEVKKEGNTLELTLRSTLPGLRDFLVRWAFQENNSKIISWYLGSATESHLLKFTSIKKDQNK